MKKGFTLVELLGVIIILTVLVLLVIPSVINLAKGSSKDIDDTTKKLLYDAAKLYISDNPGYYEENNGNSYCISIQDLISDKYIDSEVKLFENEEDISNKVVEAKYQNGFDYELKSKSECTERILYKDSTGANVPDLMNNSLVPVTYDEENSSWKVVDPTTEWYDYSKQKWANAVVLKSGVTKATGDSVRVPTSTEDVDSSDVAAMFVWIPRYSYTIKGKYGKNGTGTSSPGAIDIKFVNQYTNDNGSATYTEDEVSGWYTPPAFTFGSNELKGIWVGKFETTGDGDNPTILPNQTSLRYQTVSAQFETAQKFNTILKNLGDSHMAKNSEWGAVVYISHSIYGKIGEVYVNNCKSYITGIGADEVNGSQSETTCNNNDNKYNGSKGVNASTTGNVYGVYDMSGGAYEYVMGYSKTGYTNTWGALTENGVETDHAKFTSQPDAKYFDEYTSTNKTSCPECKGHALYETMGWYDDLNYFVVSSVPWVLRGGNTGNSGIGGTDNKGAGIFNFYYNRGYGNEDYSFRIIISPI